MITNFEEYINIYKTELDFRRKKKKAKSKKTAKG